MRSEKTRFPRLNFNLFLSLILSLTQLQLHTITKQLQLQKRSMFKSLKFEPIEIALIWQKRKMLRNGSGKL